MVGVAPLCTFPLTCHRFWAQVDGGELTIRADKWPAFLYDKKKYNARKEWVGLFLGETFVCVSILFIISSYPHSHILRVAYVYWSAPRRPRSGHMVLPPQGHTLLQTRREMWTSPTSPRSPRKWLQASFARYVQSIGILDECRVSEIITLGVRVSENQ